MPRKGKQTRRAITVNRDTYKRIADYAEKHNLSMSSVLEYVIARALSEDTKGRSE